ncbi:SDR family oxidoreductase [Thermaerobacter sp. PB12/4term]|uniref:SDR family oxidoreductase n=1 Tax=Thermaerobacter sp. PB12/4term TaxID=2293838 RepID=UPI000E3263B3|nr:SDR family oxidoreductase [Thermaerobacter sp. PB12/4term]QIA27683.1 SDR family oxidoreductase [Thermaerobacter sp. PB12/4term]
MSFAGKVALVTGASRGIGEAVARTLGGEGATVFVHFKQREEDARQVAEAIARDGGRGIPVQADLEDPQAVAAMMDRIREEAGVLDILVANAAATAFKPLLAVGPHNIQRTFAITIQAFIQMVQAAVPLMQGRAGKIVAVSGYDSIRFIPGHGILGAAKAAMESLVRYLAVELAPLGINVNAVCPGPVETDSARFYAGDRWHEVAARLVAATPRKRVATPEDVARIIRFLCTDDAGWLCGQTLVCDGGLTLDGGATLFGMA